MLLDCGKQRLQEQTKATLTGTHKTKIDGISGFTKAFMIVTLIFFLKTIFINYLRFKVSNISYK